MRWHFKKINEIFILEDPKMGFISMLPISKNKVFCQYSFNKIHIKTMVLSLDAVLEHIGSLDHHAMSREPEKIHDIFIPLKEMLASIRRSQISVNKPSYPSHFFQSKRWNPSQSIKQKLSQSTTYCLDALHHKTADMKHHYEGYRKF